MNRAGREALPSAQARSSIPFSFPHSPLGNLTLSTFKIHARLTVTSHPQAASISPRVVAAAPRWPCPCPRCRFSLFSTWQPGSPVKTRSEQGSQLKTLQGLPFPLAVKPCCGSPGLPRPAAHPKLQLLSGLLLFSSVPLRPGTLPPQGPHVCCSLWCDAFPSCFHMDPSLLRSAQMSPSHEPSLTTLFKTAAHPCLAILLGYRP